jgi:hypothetical protein
MSLGKAKRLYEIAIPNAAIKIKTVEKLTVNQQMEMVIQ